MKSRGTPRTVTTKKWSWYKWRSRLFSAKARWRCSQLGTLPFPARDNLSHKNIVRNSFGPCAENATKRDRPIYYRSPQVSDVSTCRDGRYCRPCYRPRLTSVNTANTRDIPNKHVCMIVLIFTKAEGTKSDGGVFMARGRPYIFGPRPRSRAHKRGRLDVCIGLCTTFTVDGDGSAKCWNSSGDFIRPRTGRVTFRETHTWKWKLHFETPTEEIRLFQTFDNILFCFFSTLAFSCFFFVFSSCCPNVMGSFSSEVETWELQSASFPC